MPDLRSCYRHGGYTGTDCPRCAGEGKVLRAAMRSPILHAVISNFRKGNGTWEEAMEAAVLLLEQESHCLLERLMRALPYVPDAAGILKPDKPKTLGD